MNKRDYKGAIIFELDRDGDKYDSFEKAVSFIRKNYGIQEIKFYSGFFDDAYFIFLYKDVEIKVEFSGFLGTELKVSENTPSELKSEILILAKKIYEDIHIGNSTNPSDNS